jgi:membrane protein implicated in regulation of membrane protease activity
MLRTVLTLGLLALLGLAALKLVFGVFTGLLGTLLGLFFWLLGVALQIALVGLVVYGIIRLVSPETARRLRERFSGEV